MHDEINQQRHIILIDSDNRVSMHMYDLEYNEQNYVDDKKNRYKE